MPRNGRMWQTAPEVGGKGGIGPPPAFLPRCREAGFSRGSPAGREAGQNRPAGIKPGEGEDEARKPADHPGRGLQKEASMPMQVSFRIKNLKSGEATGAVSHDFRKPGKIPNYVDRAKTSQNAILFGGQPDVQASIQEQAERVKMRTGKKLRKDANLFLSGIITFSKDSREQVNGSPPDSQAMKFAEKFAGENRVKLLYLVRHSDETTTHYHCLWENISDRGESVKNKLSPPVLSKWQDIAGQVFSSAGIGRGTPKAVRLAAGEDASKTIHRSVRKLHEDLPREIAQEEARLREVAERRVALEWDLRETIRSEAKALPPLPEPELLEAVTERTMLGGVKTENVRVFRVKPVRRFLEALAPRLAAARLLEREVVPREDFREIQAERDELARELAETKRKLSEARESVFRLEAALAKAKEFVAWIKSGFPEIFSRYVLMSQRGPEPKESVTSNSRVTCHDSGEPEDDSVAPR